MLRPPSQAYKQVSDDQKEQVSTVPQMAGKNLIKLSKATRSGAHPLAVYPPVAILLSVVTAITEQYNYLEH